MKQRFRKILLCLVLGMGSQLGVPMRADEIQELMRTLNQPKLVRKFAEEEEKDGAPPPIAESRTS